MEHLHRNFIALNETSYNLIKRYKILLTINNVKIIAVY
jgi:hypothetical protein